MKTKILSIAAAATTIALMMAACNPLDEVYAELDKAQEPYHEDIAYTLTDADYAAASTAALKLAQNATDSAAAKRIKSELAFNSVYGPEELVPAQLAATYKALNKKSTAQVTYNHNLENTTYLEAIKDSLKSHTYTVTDDDYTAIGGSVANVGYFIPSTPAIEFIPNILKAQYPSATKGDYAFVNYKQSNLEPADGTPVPKVIFEENWNSYAKDDSVGLQIANWYAYIPDTAAAGKDKSYWPIKEYKGDRYPEFSAYNAQGSVESWIISPKIDIPIGTNTLLFDVKVAHYNATCLSVKLSTDFDGSDASVATWIDITSNFTLPKEPTSGYGKLLSAGTYDLSKYAGQSIYIAFAYKGNSTSDPKETTTYQVENIKIINGPLVDLFEQRNDVYSFNGTKWEQSARFMAVQPADKDRVSSTDKAKTYLPMLLANNYPYALEGDTALAVYSNGETITKWAYTNGQWGVASTIEQRTIQFIHNGQFWLFDPAVNYTMTKDDHQIMVDYIRNHAELNIFHNKKDKGKDSEFYYGFSVNYNNISFRLSYRESYLSSDTELSALSTTEEKLALLWKRSEEGMRIFLELRFPDAVPEVSGIEVYYHVQVNVYGSDGDIAPAVPYIYTYRCTGSNPATFEFVERKQVE